MTELKAAESAWRAAVAKYKAAINASIDADRGKPHNPIYDPNDAQYAPITEAGLECGRTYKIMQDIRKRLGMPEFRP